jgi:hypothetical protein
MPPEIVDEITTPRGEGYAEAPGFTVRKNELYELMKHWYRTARGLQFDYFMIQIAGGRESWLRNFAYARFDSIAEVLGHEVAKRAMAEVDKEYREKEPYFWRAFVRGIAVRRGDDGSPLPEEVQPPLWVAKNSKRKPSRGKQPRAA